MTPAGTPLGRRPPRVERARHQLGEGVVDVRAQLLHLGQQLAARKEPEVDPVEVREHRHVEPRPLGDRPDR